MEEIRPDRIPSTARFPCVVLSDLHVEAMRATSTGWKRIVREVMVVLPGLLLLGGDDANMQPLGLLGAS